ncbi:MAG TPA: hypothetical protein VK970_01215 [Candidatus Methylacidiphilales bacterium]|nr:hypothetical protein [Candidatus Methylacidiphilales bacterium]
MIDLSKLIARSTTPGGFRVAQSNAITDLTLLSIATEYEANVTQKITSLLPADLEARFTGTEQILETTKYDGEGVFLFFDASRESDKAVCFNAPSGRTRLAFPALNAFSKILSAAGVKKALFRGELYLPPLKEGVRRSIADVVRATFSGSVEDIGSLRLAVLDVIMLDGKDLRANQTNFTTTWELLGQYFPPAPELSALAEATRETPCHRMEGSIISERDIPKSFSRKTLGGGEGVVLRRLGRIDIYKVKPYRTIDAVIIGYVEGEFEGKFGVTSLLTALTYPAPSAGDSTVVSGEASAAGSQLYLQTFARAGSGLTDDQRINYQSMLSPYKVAAPLPMTDSDGRIIHFIRPRIIVELGGEDLVTTAGRGTENRTQYFIWDPVAGAYTFAGLTPCPRLVFPRIIHLREDKELQNGGARIAQIVANPVLPGIRQQQEVTPPQVIRREVYAKGTDAVRKLVVVHKPAETVFPYVVMWTDYSSRRAEPLKVTTQIAATEERAKALADKLVAENVTKGFLRTEADGSTSAATAPAAKPAKKSAAKAGAAAAAAEITNGETSSVPAPVAAVTATEQPGESDVAGTTLVPAMESLSVAEAAGTSATDPASTAPKKRKSTKKAATE